MESVCHILPFSVSQAHIEDTIFQEITHFIWLLRILHLNLTVFFLNLTVLREAFVSIFCIISSSLFDILSRLCKVVIMNNTLSKQSGPCFFGRT